MRMEPTRTAEAAGTFVHVFAGVGAATIDAVARYHIDPAVTRVYGGTCRPPLDGKGCA